MIKYFQDTMRILYNSIESIDDKLFEKLTKNCVDALQNKHKVVVSGLGKNVPVCDKFKRRFYAHKFCCAWRFGLGL